MSSRVRPRHCVLLGAAVAMSLNPVGGNALAGTAVGSAHEAPAVVLGGGESGELPTRSATRLDFLEDELTSPDDLFADVARDPKTGSVRVSSPKGTREWSASALSDHGMPVVAERAYRNAARRMAGTDPACQLPWTLLAGIGRVESDHGRYGGSTLGRDGVSHPLIIGVQLNGAGPVAAIPDSDNGKLDKDKVWDRAVGPMQFIPTTWASAGRDGDGDGVASPNDIDDATLAAAGYLCSGSGSVLSEAGMAAALLRYNPSDSYVALVMAFERGYRTGSFVMPAPVEPETSQGARSGRGKAGARGNSKTSPAKPKPSRGPSGGPSATPDPRPAPEPKPPATPKPTPKPPKPTPKPVSYTHLTLPTIYSV